ncbi:AAA family ATPase [candidate division TA06 bacterium]|uniref:AAA family ATPase n=1 Tax=candidate division TA06 bacterium TaxID=2250710 RepID=A0A933I9H1_UNCT6|nr:AAA family ATPase [candidate division TA06 bacterium]
MPISEINNTRPPENARDLAKWFNEAIVGEIQFLEKNSREQNYELLYGQQINSGKDYATYIFHLADGTRLPEEADGKLCYDTLFYIADIIRQEGNTIELKLSGSNLPPKIYRATLSIDDTALLKKLSEKLSKIENKETTITNCANLVFHPKNGPLSATESYTPNLSTELRSEQADTIIRCCNSEITYVWGPPGTGKTHLITNLLAALLDKNERVLITSHTKKAVDQALYEAIKEEGNKRGVLAGQQIIAACKVLRLGVIGESTNNLPDNVVFDKALNNRTIAWNEQISKIEQEIKLLTDKITYGKKYISEWVKLEEYSDKINHLTNRLTETNKTIHELIAEKSYDQELLTIAKDSLEKAEHSWFNKKSKLEKAQNSIAQAIKSREITEESLKKESQNKDYHTNAIAVLNTLRDKQGATCKSLLPKETYEKEIDSLSLLVNTEQTKINELKDNIRAASTVLLNESRALFCTLTKSYVAKELENQEFDAVIIDEISMALPPLVFLAAGKAKKRVILVGDFKQLPPIIRSDTVIGNTRLKNDVFYLSGLVDSAGKVNELEQKILCKLTRQSRMLKEIATVSRYLSYRKAGLILEDELEKLEYAQENRKRREHTNAWLDFLPQSPLVIIDTSEWLCCVNKG